jgi:hypothetical protein
MHACSQCAAVLRPGASFCHSCGDAVAVAVAAPEPPPPPPPSPPTPPEPPAPPAPPAFVTYNALPAQGPPRDIPEPETEALPEPVAASAPPAAPAPVLAPPAPPAPEPPPPAAPPPSPPAAPQYAAPARERWSDGRIVAIAVTAVLLLGGIAAAIVLSGGSDTPKPVADTAARAAPPEADRATATPKAGPDIRRQVQTLDDLMQASVKGRAAAVKGQMKAAIANRAKLVADLRELRSQAKDPQLQAGLASFAAAIRESLRQNRECPDGCPASELNRVNRLKQQTVARLNPLLRKYAKTSYRSQDI